MQIEREIIRVRNDKKEKIVDSIVVEKQINIYVNGNLFFRIMCLPVEIEELIYGLFYSNGYINKIDDIKNLKITGDACMIEIDKEIEKKVLTIGSSCFSSFFHIEDSGEGRKDYIDVEKYDITRIMIEFQRKSQVYRETGGVHSAAISDGEKIIFFSEDIGRHNAVDKVIGKMILNGFNIKEKFLLISGRISSEIVLKAYRANFSAILSPSAPTSLSIELSEKFKIVLIGFARGKRFNIYNL